jgi:hypothetical protein
MRVGLSGLKVESSCIGSNKILISFHFIFILFCKMRRTGLMCINVPRNLIFVKMWLTRLPKLGVRVILVKF